ncbi:NUDIX domain-containing protein [Streptomyces sp. NPDC088748]|uniref:NUDIX domain-containing protein n=1 Tax=Streptomyces sp. NPDC088748 TaxID=3365887 RepID=UPI0037F709ED
MSENSETPDYFKNPPPRRFGALAFLEAPDDRFAVIERSYWTEVSRWGLPGGSAAPNELPRRALARHLAEKLHVRLTADRLLLVDHAPAVPDKHHEGANFVYHKRLAELPQDVRPARGYTGLRWVTPEQAEGLLLDHELLRFRACLQAVRSSAFGVELLLGNPMI